MKNKAPTQDEIKNAMEVIRQSEIIKDELIKVISNRLPSLVGNSGEFSNEEKLKQVSIANFSSTQFLVFIASNTLACINKNKRVEHLDDMIALIRNQILKTL